MQHLLRNKSCGPSSTSLKMEDEYGRDCVDLAVAAVTVDHFDEGTQMIFDFRGVIHPKFFPQNNHSQNVTDEQA